MGEVPTIKIFTPKLDELNNFPRYVDFMETQGAHLAGIAKIIPPPEWIPRQNSYDDLDSNFIISSATYQTYEGQNGLYQISHTCRTNSKFIKFKEMANQNRYKPPNCSPDELEAKFWSEIAGSKALYGAGTEG